MMTKRELGQQYLKWAETAQIEDPPDLTRDRITLRIDDLLETDDLLVGQIYYAVPIRTAKLNVFLYSEQTVWKKDWFGNTITILDESYQVI